MNNQLTKNFQLSEFDCKDGTKVPERLYDNVLLLAQQLQVLRDDINTNRPAMAPKDVQIPIHVNSGYRTPSYNKKVGGAKESQHLKGKAGDITCKWVTPSEMKARIEKLIKAGKMLQGGLGKYPGFVHYDHRGTKARW